VASHQDNHFKYPVVLEYLSELATAIANVPKEPVALLVDLLLEAQASGQRVYTMGNGGSMAIASQFVCNLGKTARVDGSEPLRVFALTDNGPSLTAWANDSEYGKVFAEQVKGLVEPGDIVIAISASGNSPNIIAGLAAAKDKRARTVGLLGFDGGSARSMVDIAVHIPYSNYGVVEDTHMAIGHAVTGALRQALQSFASS
jgi:D-sedoheptulose 7-phosphate isomerase